MPNHKFFKVERTGNYRDFVFKTWKIANPFADIPTGNEYDIQEEIVSCGRKSPYAFGKKLREMIPCDHVIPGIYASNFHIDGLAYRIYYAWQILDNSGPCAAAFYVPESTMNAIEAANINI